MAQTFVNFKRLRTTSVQEESPWAKQFAERHDHLVSACKILLPTMIQTHLSHVEVKIKCLEGPYPTLRKKNYAELFARHEEAWQQ